MLLIIFFTLLNYIKLKCFLNNVNKHIKLLLLSSYLWYLAEGLFGPLYAIFTERIGGNILDITGAYAVYMIVAGILYMFVGKIADKHSMEKMMVAGYAIYAAGTFGYLLVDTPLKLFMLQALLGAAIALATPTWNALYSKHLDEGKFGEEWGLSDGGPSIISGVSILIGGIIITYADFTVLFLLMGLIQTISTIVTFRILFMSPEKTYRKHLKKKRFRSYLHR